PAESRRPRAPSPTGCALCAPATNLCVVVLLAVPRVVSRRRMAEITDYERRGDLDAPFELTKKDHRAQKERERIRDAVGCDVPMLTWEQYAAGAPCPGCGRSYRDDEPWDFRGTMNFTDEERARYEAEQDRFEQDHGECHAMRHSVSGSLTTHCGKCCPPPPLSPTQLKEIGR